MRVKWTRTPGLVAITCPVAESAGWQPLPHPWNSSRDGVFSYGELAPQMEWVEANPSALSIFLPSLTVRKVTPPPIRQSGETTQGKYWKFRVGGPLNSGHLHGKVSLLGLCDTQLLACFASLYFIACESLHLPSGLHFLILICSLSTSIWQSCGLTYSLDLTPPYCLACPTVST